MSPVIIMPDSEWESMARLKKELRKTKLELQKAVNLLDSVSHHLQYKVRGFNQDKWIEKAEKIIGDWFAKAETKGIEDE